MKAFYPPIAALIMFTKLPVWKLVPDIPAEAYRKVVTWWPLAGWLTGGLCAGVLLLLYPITSPLVAAVFAVGARVLFTGAYHEDGVADFFDGFGGGHDKQQILSIMKDSHIGTYGVLALILFLLALTSMLSSLPPLAGVAMILAADPFAKFCAGRMLSFLPYARSDSKNLATYPCPDIKATVIAALFGTIPAIVFALCNHVFIWPLTSAMIAVIAVCACLFLYMHRRIGGYTGDCCGAVCYMCESAFCLTFIIVYHHTCL